ncbi:hypothetical protein ACFFSY_20420 [Paenibacillus aurantiacus]|uniref:DUF4179 domain-containing protein n=1 Tax=Paenibacillus aurantiacus TaxID=1936118 RepID=A0ABV5KUQ0_9BACL
MSHDWKRDIDSIPLPSSLRERSLRGIAQAQAEIEDESVQVETSREVTGGSRRRSRAFVALAACVAVLLLALASLQPSVRAALTRVVQFIPGFGIVKEEDKARDRYVLEHPVTIRLEDDEITITGMLVEENNVYISMAGNNPGQKPETIAVRNEAGEVYTIKTGMSTWSSHQWVADYWHEGSLDIGAETVMLTLGALHHPDIAIPLAKAESAASYAELGETMTRNGVMITAVAAHDGARGRITLVSTVPQGMSVIDYGLSGLTDGRRISLIGPEGMSYELEKEPALTAPTRVFYFDLNPSLDGAYTLEIPEINVKYSDSASFTVPTETAEQLNITFDLAGFPVTITRTVRIGDNLLRIYTDLHGDAEAARLLHFFNLAGRGFGAKLNDRTGAMEYIELGIERNEKSIKLKAEDPQVLVRGPWTFRLDADRYFRMKEE